MDFNPLRSFAKLFRTVAQVCVALALLSWAFDCIPSAVRVSGEFLRRLAAVVASPVFVFLLGNAIVAALVAKSRCGNRGDDNAEEDVYEDLIKSSSDNDRFPIPNSLSENPINPYNCNIPPCHVSRDEVVYQDKEIILSQVTPEDTENKDHTASYYVSDSDSDPDAGKPKVYRRAKSEKRLRERKREYNKVTRRWDTEKKGSRQDAWPEDELSDEDFQRAVEDFIAKHLKFRREESLAIVLQNQTNPYPHPPLVESARS